MLHELALFTMVFALSAAAPGADTMLLFGRALSGGARAAAPLAVGITVGKLVLLTLAAVGVTAAAAALGPLFIAVKLAGAAYLVLLGIRLWRRDPRRPATAASAPAGSRSFGRGAATGLGLAVSNPQAILFYVAVLPTVVRPGSGAGLYLALAAMLCAVMASVAGGYIALGARARSAAGSPTARRRADRLAGTLLIGAGALIATR